MAELKPDKIVLAVNADGTIHRRGKAKQLLMLLAPVIEHLRLEAIREDLGIEPRLVQTALAVQPLEVR